MILPKDVKGRNRIRDSKILSLYLESVDTRLIAKQFNITQPRVIQIAKFNASMLLEQKDWNKLQRLTLIKEDLKKPEFQEQILTKKDMLELWRKEFESEEKQTTVNNVTYHIHGTRKGHRFEVLPSPITTDNS